MQLLSLCMGKHQILQNCSLSLRLNFIFEITNEIGQQLCHKCCFFCSNSVIKSLFFRLDQEFHRPCAVLNARLGALTVSIATGTSNGSCSDALTLPISDWLFYSEGGASCDRATILSVAVLGILYSLVTCDSFDKRVWISRKESLMTPFVALWDLKLFLYCSAF